MHLKFRNVNDAFKGLVSKLHTGEIPTHVCASRAGEVAMVEEPVIVTYEKPLERVLFNAARDANPFFHLYEALWMLTGRNDVAPLAYYNSKIAEIASDGGKTFNGAYGYRWRSKMYWEEDSNASPGDVPQIQVDQLKVIIDHLTRMPESRRAVLSMWNVYDDLLRVGSDLDFMQGRLSKDVCCNLSVCFSVEQGVCRACEGLGRLLHGWDDEKLQRKIDQEYDMARCARHDNDVTDEKDRYVKIKEYREGYQRCYRCKGKPHDQPHYLNMTVFNRSNDLLWGMLGSNVVCFSILQEYMAAHLGLEVGVYNQATNNLHYYTERWEAEKWLKADTGDWYRMPGVEPKTLNLCFPLIRNLEMFDKELPEFVDTNYPKSPKHVPMGGKWREPFFAQVAQPMLNAFHEHKRKHYLSAANWVGQIAADDWRIVAEEWLERRRGWVESKATGAP